MAVSCGTLGDTVSSPSDISPCHAICSVILVAGSAKQDADLDISRRRRDLIFVVSGFTIGHSLTLALAVIGIILSHAE
jgi:hypothetical protein